MKFVFEQQDLQRFDLKLKVYMSNFHSQLQVDENLNSLNERFRCLVDDGPSPGC